jgi:fructose-bisphosphate aldolase class II
MTRAETGELVGAARAAGTAALAFNVITLEHAEGILAGAVAADRAVILQISQNAARYHGGDLRPLVAAIAALVEASPVPASVHLDHVDDVGLLFPPLPGVSSAMFDASRQAYADNVLSTARTAAALHGAGLWVEAELGEVGGKDGAHAPGARTDPREAAQFVAATGVDALAVAVGSSHAMTTRTAAIDLDLVARLAAAVPVPLVLHGSSGVPADQLRAAAAAGIAKINIGTALNIAFTGRIRAVLAEQPDLTDPRRYLAPARDAVSGAVERLFAEVAGTAGAAAAGTAPAPADTARLPR